MIKNFSVSQLKTFRDCPRKWFNQYVLRKPVPPSLALDKGNDLHAAAEAHLKGGPVPAAVRDYGVYVEALRPYFAPPGEEVLVEHWMTMPTQFGIPFKGKIDYVRYAITPAKLLDWKSTSDPRWMLTPEEVREDIQTNIYAHYLFEEGLDEPLEGGLVYVHLKDKPPKSADKVKVVPRTVDIPRERAACAWAEIQPDLAAMIATAELGDHNRVAPKTSACGKYGGCPFRTDCGITPIVSISNKNKGESVMSFRDRLRNRQNGQTGAGVPAPAASTAAPAPGQVVPNDAPPRTAGGADPAPQPSAQAAQPAAEAPKRRTRRKAADAAPAASTPAPAPSAPAATASSNGAATAAASAGSMVLYVDCLPVKGQSGDDITLFDDWIATTVFELNAWAEEEKRVPHYQLVGFAEEKAAVAMAVQDRIAKSGLPPAMHVSTANQLARDVLPMLVPHAELVVRAIRS